jgi:hypothetical protein
VCSMGFSKDGNASLERKIVGCSLPAGAVLWVLFMSSAFLASLGATVGLVGWISWRSCPCFFAVSWWWLMRASLARCRDAVCQRADTTSISLLTVRERAPSLPTHAPARPPDPPTWTPF